jgi:TonB-linked SusC/RagA family outer membrane protein
MKRIQKQKVLKNYSLEDGFALKKLIRMTKCTLLLFFLGVFQVMAVDSYSQMTKLSLKVNNESLEQVLAQIEDQTEFFFLYNKDLVDVEQKVNVNAKNETIKLILDNLLVGKDISYAVYDRQIVLTNKEVVSMMTGQQKSVTGKVTETGGEPLPGVTVLIKGTTNGTITNVDGIYSINNVPEGAVLVYSFVGMANQEIAVGNLSEINVTLISANIGLEEIVAIGYGTQRKADLTGAVSTVAPENLKQGINQSVSHALQGRVAGVTAIQNSGEPGGGVEIRIRGAGSINDNSPLYVVDGIIGSIANLNPADIENMTVLKDAASAAIYGSRGANGVVIVTTKKGKKGQKTSVSFNTSQGVQQAWKMPTSLTAEERNLIHKEALTNDNTPSSASIWNYYNDPANAVTRTDWFSEVLKPAYISNSDLSFQGGNENSNFLFSLGYLDNNGILTGTNYKKYNIRFNSQHEIVKNLTFGENLSVVVTDQQIADTRGSYDGVLSAALFNMRNTPVWEDRANQIYGAPTGDFPNPVASLNSRDITQKNNGFAGNLYLEYKFLEMFTVKTDFGYTLNNGKNKNFKSIAINGGRGLDQNGLSEYYSTNKTWIWNNTVNFDKTIDKHHIAALAGMSMESGLNEWLSSGTAKQFSNQDPALRYFNNAGAFPEHVSGSADDYALQSYFGRVTYEYDNRYLFAANIRADGSSKFPQDKRWGVFPSFSAGWRISNEAFFSGLTNVVSDFKLRGSWGQLGNDKIPNYQYYSTVSTVSSPTLGGEQFTAVAQNRFANTNIQWEVTTQTDIGIDAGFLENKIQLTADYYDKETTDILVQVPLVSSLGVGIAPFRNAGKVSNKGFEFGVGYRNRDNEFKYEISGNAATVNNKLETLGVAGAKEIFTSDYKNVLVGRIAEGEPLGHFYVLNALGIFQSADEINSYTSTGGGKIQPNAVPGDVKFEDRNKDGVISADDRFNAGNSFPTFTYSLSFNAEYKGFDANMLWIGSQGNEIFNGLKLGGTFMQGTSYNNSPEILDRWTPTSKSNSVPRVTVKDLNNNKTYSTLYIEDGSFARMKYLTFGYTFDESIIGNSISKLRLYVTFQNLITISNYSGYDPEIGADGGFSNNMYGVDKGVYPQAKAYILGLNINF